jgi:hypothetical protein
MLTLKSMNSHTQDFSLNCWQSEHWTSATALNAKSPNTSLCYCCGYESLQEGLLYGDNINLVASGEAWGVRFCKRF